MTTEEREAVRRFAQRLEAWMESFCEFRMCDAPDGVREFTDKYFATDGAEPVPVKGDDNDKEE